jgi:2-aminoadipate transaminase
MTSYDRFLSRAAERMQQSAIRKMGTVMARSPGIISFAPGYPAPETFPWADLHDIAGELLSSRDDDLLQYGPTRGHPPLLDALLQILEERGIRSSVEELMVTTGSQQGLDLVSRVLLDPGDVALVELPTYTGAITAFRNAQAELVGVAQEADGIDLAHLEDVLTRQRAAGRRVPFLYVVPNFQNPTGRLMSLPKRRRLLEWAAREDMLIIEDDPYGDLYFVDSASSGDTRPIKADDADGRVVYLSSFSKVLAPGFRVAWVSAPAALAAKFEMAKQASDLLTGPLDQRIVYEACRRGVVAHQGPRLREHYREKCDVMMRGLRAELGDLVSWPPPQGGFFLWVTLPEPIDAERPLSRCLRHGVIFVTGSAFFVDGSGSNIARLSFSAPPPAQIAAGVKCLAAAIREELANVKRKPG